MGRTVIHPMVGKLKRNSIIKELQEQGYAIIPNALVEARCDEKLQRYKEWYATFEESGESIRRNNFVIEDYRISHYEPSWEIRTHVRQLFGLIWGTDKLLTSVEGITLFNPPEKGEGEFRTPDACDLRLDQPVQRQGLHAYRGAVYLEESTADDFCIRFLTGSHQKHTAFFKAFPRAAERSRKIESIKLGKNERTWFFDHGCKLINVTVPKGSMLLWDSRMIYDFVLPECGRPNIDRWTCISFVSMTPALWADNSDMELKRKVFKEMLTTTHWSSQGQKIIEDKIPRKRNADGEVVKANLAVKYLPAVALWYPSQKLMGSCVMKYDFENDQPNGPPPPIWK